MSARQGFTLIEIIVVLIILGITAAVAIPNFVTSIEQTKAQSVKNNLLAISAAQSKFNEDWGAYCISTGANPTGSATTCGDTYDHLNAFLRLNISSNGFTYNCTNAAVPYFCTATDGKVTLSMTGAVISCTVGGGYCPQT